MKGNELQSNTKSESRVFEQVFDRQHRRVRGLWQRDGTLYAQVQVLGQPRRIALQGAETIPDAVRARQELKKKIEAGEYPPKKVGPKLGPVVSGAPPVPAVDHSLGAAITGYQATRDSLKQVDEATAYREDSSLVLWSHFAGSKHISEVDSKLLQDHAQNRSKTATALRKERLEAEVEELKAEEGISEEDREAKLKWRNEKLKAGLEAKDVSGRAKDLDVQTLGKVLDWALTNKFLKTKPDLTWTKLAKSPRKVRLLTQEELGKFANANLPVGDIEELAKDQPKEVRFLWAHQAKRGQAFRDFIYLIFYAGPREEETTMLRWEHVHWSTPEKQGHLFFPGENAKAGAGKPAEDRSVDFNDKLEAHLKEMYERRDKSSPWLFPSSWDPTKHQKSFRKQLDLAREATGWYDIGFHHGRHFFISHAVAANINFKQIAIWVSHSDGGLLIGKKYSHLVPGHGAVDAKKITFAKI
jgi:integrase